MLIWITTFKEGNTMENIVEFQKATYILNTIMFLCFGLAIISTVYVIAKAIELLGDEYRKEPSRDKYIFNFKESNYPYEHPLGYKAYWMEYILPEETILKYDDFSKWFNSIPRMSNRMPYDTQLAMRMVWNLRKQAIKEKSLEKVSILKTLKLSCWVFFNLINKKNRSIKIEPTASDRRLKIEIE